MSCKSEESDGFAVLKVDSFGVGNARQSGHSHNVAKIGNDKAAAALDVDVADGDAESGQIQDSILDLYKNVQICIRLNDCSYVMFVLLHQAAFCQ